jgi:hypothetical protein
VVSEEGGRLSDIPLDFRCKASVCGVDNEDDAMASEVTELTIRCFLAGIRERLETATAVAKAAEPCCQAGRTDQALTIALDAEQPLYEVTTYLKAASLLNRCSKS